MRKIIYILLFFAVACQSIDDGNPYDGNLSLLNVEIFYPKGFDGYDKSDQKIGIEDIQKGSKYSVITDLDGGASIKLPKGLYRLSLSTTVNNDMFNAVLDKVAVAEDLVNVDLNLAYSKPGDILIKELYVGGCKKLPIEGNHNSDKYMILHNNTSEVQYLDSLCLGMLTPYNSVSNSPWTEEIDFVPVIQAVWQFGGDGDDFSLLPGEDAVIALNGAIDHSLEYPLSVNLNKSEYFVCYNKSYFSNESYHPAPGDKIQQSRILDVVIKTGQANAYSISVSSPAIVIFKSKGVSMQEYITQPNTVIPLPGSTSDNVVTIPFDWVVDAVEVFDGRSSSNKKRLNSIVDAGYVLQTDVYSGYSLRRNVNEEKTIELGYEVLLDTNNSTKDFYQSAKATLHSSNKGGGDE